MPWRRNGNRAVIIINDNNKSNRKIKRGRVNGKEERRGAVVEGSSEGARLISDALVVSKSFLIMLNISTRSKSGFAFDGL